jgi:hypothetical protein
MARIKKLNIKQLLKKRLTNSKSLQNLAYGAAIKKSERLKKELVEEFDQHPVTKELEQGTSGTSSLLGGRGNLFGFLGFNEGQNPIQILRTQIKSSIKITNPKGRVKKLTDTSFIYSFDISVPSDSQVYKVTPLQWSTKSWVKGVEKGITNYANTLFRPSKNSRSGIAIQSERKIGFIKFRPTPYITDMLSQLRKELK